MTMQRFGFVYRYALGKTKITTGHHTLERVCAKGRPEIIVSGRMQSSKTVSSSGDFFSGKRERQQEEGIEKNMYWC